MPTDDEGREFEWDVIDGYEVVPDWMWAESWAKWCKPSFPDLPPLDGPLAVDALKRGGIGPDLWNEHDHWGWGYHHINGQWQVTRPDQLPTYA